MKVWWQNWLVEQRIWVKNEFFQYHHHHFKLKLFLVCVILIHCFYVCVRIVQCFRIRFGMKWWWCPQDKIYSCMLSSWLLFVLIPPKSLSIWYWIHSWGLSIFWNLLFICLDIISKQRYILPLDCVIQVCKEAASTKEEWEEQCKLWPTSYHPPT